MNSKSIIVTLYLLCLLAIPSLSSVSLSNLKQFFSATYDINQDGYASLQEFINYYHFLQPDHEISDTYLASVFAMFDTDSNGKVTLQELISLVSLKINVHAGHKQIHIGLTAKERQMQVMWVSTPEHYRTPYVQYGHLPIEFKLQANATIKTYNVGHLGFHGSIYRAVLKELEPNKRYYYRVGDRETQTFSNTKYFTSPPLRVQQLEELNIAVFGDMGTFAPFGHFVAQKIAKDNFLKPFNFVFLTGDIAYAGMNSQKVGEFEPIWDLFGEITESFAAYTAFMPGVGNHEKYYNYTSYMNRYVLPRTFPGQTNLWFSFDYGQIHMVHFSSEHLYNKGSQQYVFLQNDLRGARQNPNIQWIILGVHRAFYSSDVSEYANVTNLAFHLEDLVNQYKVDIVQTGHLHDYERSWPTYKGKAIKEGQNQTHFVDPKAPIYVVQGTAGALIRQKFLSPTPQWSIKHHQMYGYGRISIKGNTLKYQYVVIPSGRVYDEWSIIKSVNKAANVEAKSQ